MMFGRKINVLLIFFQVLNSIIAEYFIKPTKNKKLEELKNSIRSGKIKNVLILRNDGIGDAVVSINFIKEVVKLFENVKILSSKHNDFVFKMENIRTLIDVSGKFRKGHSKASLMYAITTFMENVLHVFETKIKATCPKYDLIIDLKGDPSLLRKYSAKYAVGQNEGMFSLFYTYFLNTSYALADSNLVESYQNLMKLIGIHIKVKDLPPKGFHKNKKAVTFIFVGCKSERNLKYLQWKRIILLASKYQKCIIADDPQQNIMNILTSDIDIINNPKIELLIGYRKLNNLAEISNESNLMISVDGGAEHFLERYTNALVIYTCGVYDVWKPYSETGYKKRSIANNCAYAYTTTSIGLKKFIFYANVRCRPCYIMCGGKKCVNFLDVELLDKILRISSNPQFELSMTRY